MNVRDFVRGGILLGVGLIILLIVLIPDWTCSATAALGGRCAIAIQPAIVDSYRYFVGQGIRDPYVPPLLLAVATLLVAVGAALVLHGRVAPASAVARGQTSTISVLAVATVLGVILYGLITVPQLQAQEVQCLDIAGYAFADFGLWNRGPSTYARWEVYVNGRYYGGDNTAFLDHQYKRHHFNLTGLSQARTPDNIIWSCGGQTLTVLTFVGSLDQYPD